MHVHRRRRRGDRECRHAGEREGVPRRRLACQLTSLTFQLIEGSKIGLQAAGEGCDGLSQCRPVAREGGISDVEDRHQPPDVTALAEGALAAAQVNEREEQGPGGEWCQDWNNVLLWLPLVRQHAHGAACFHEASAASVAGAS